MTIKLFWSAIIKFTLGVVLAGLLLFLPAGTFNYPNAWLFMGILFIPMFVAGFLVASLDFRFGWLPLPEMVS